jgi:hypothetical protein
MTHSRRYAEKIESAPAVRPSKASTTSDAKAWGRLAARLNWGLLDLADEVEESFRGIAATAYHQQMIKLHGAPF